MMSISLIIGYMVIAALYSYFYAKKLDGEPVKTYQLVFLGSTWGLHLLVTIFAYLYYFTGLRIGYYVALTLPKEEDNEETLRD